MLIRSWRSCRAGPGVGLGGSNGTQGVGPKQQCQNFGDEYGFVAGAGGAGGGADDRTEEEEVQRHLVELVLPNL